MLETKLILEYERQEALNIPKHKAVKSHPGAQPLKWWKFILTNTWIYGSLADSISRCAESDLPQESCSPCAISNKILALSTYVELLEHS